MNSFFGSSPIGPPKSSSPASTKGASNTTTNGASGTTTTNSNNNGGGGWGSMFKSALNQVETHLDRYLELPNEGGPPNARGAVAGRQPARSTTPRPRQSTTATTTASANPQDIISGPAKQTDNGSRSHSQSRVNIPRDISGTSGNSIATPAFGSYTSVSDLGSRQKSTVVVDVKDNSADAEGLDANLLDIFGVKLSQGQKTKAPGASAVGSPAPAASGLNKQHPLARGSMELQQRIETHNEFESATTPTTTTSTTPEPALAAKVDNPYIQAELRKLRAGEIPTRPEDMRAMIEDYAKRIEALMLEGQEWSAKELRLSNTVKKLRVDSKGYEKTAHLVQRKLDASVAKNDELNEKLRQATQSDRAIAARVRSELAQAHAQKEKALVAQISQLKMASESTQERLQAQVRELQQQMMVVEEEARDREVSSLTKIRSLQARVCSADMQNSDVAAVIQKHTRPLLMQIEEMLMRQTEQRREWSRKEAQLAIEARDAAKEALKLEQQLLDRTSALEAIRGQAAVETKRREDIQAEASRLKEQLRAETRSRAALKQQLEEAQENIRRLNTKLESTSSLRAMAAAENMARSTSPLHSATVSSSERGLPAGFLNLTRAPVSPMHSGGPVERNVPGHGRALSVSSVSSADSRPRRGSGAESLASSFNAVQSASDPATVHTLAKKLGAQITSLKVQLQTAQRQKNEYSRSLVEMTAELETLRKQSIDQDQLAHELDELKHRHETALEMLGEKTEEVMELRADIKEIKDAFRQQLEALLGEKN